MLQSLLVFSHLRWDFVFQRPQHLMSRLARDAQVYFFEEPVYDPAGPWLEYSAPLPGVRVCRPHTPIAAGGFHDEQIASLKALLAELIASERLTDYGVWFYSPMALPLMQGLAPRVVVYDCMDELAAFRNAPKQLLQRESALLKVADVVFTGGRSLYRAKCTRHFAVHCFPSSVDRAHFARARNGLAEHPAQQALRRPRLGFFGVLDERIDLDLIDALAHAGRNWDIALVGPVAKIDAQALPRSERIHYFGTQSYADLPSFVAGWDVCLLPFALNEATRFISPTKTLEYMAAGKPIVSTRIVDVVEPYGEIVRIARDAAQFVAACEEALAADEEDRRRRTAAMDETLAGTSWDATAAQMRELIEDAARARLRPPLPEPAATGAARLSAARAAAYRTVIVGAGPTGLSAAYHCGRDSLLLERNAAIGGWCRSLEDNGFTFDYAGHIMFSNDAYVHELYRLLLGDNVHWQDREAWVYSKNVFTRYPFQSALCGLPPDVLKECLIGAIEARFGPLKPRTGERTPAGAPADCCADGTADTSAAFVRAAAAACNAPAREPRNFEEFIYRVWGRGVAKHFAIPYNRKLWAVPLDEMETSWLGGRVPLPDLEEMIDGALRPAPKPVGPNARFGYPLRGGFQALMNGFVPHLQGEVRLNTQMVRVSPQRHEMTLADGTTLGYEHLVSTVPLPQLVRMIGHAAPESILRAAQALRHVSVRCVNLGIDRAGVTDKHWIYYPEDTVFHRIFVQGNASPCCCPPGTSSLTCEITYGPLKPLPCDGEQLIDRCIADCIKVGLLRPDDRVIARNQVDMPYAYVVYDHARKHNVELIRTWLSQHDIVLAGRYSEWEYYNSDHAFLAGKKAAERVAAQRAAVEAAGE